MNAVKLLLCSIIAMIALTMITGCSTTGPATLSNGKVYWVNSEKCANYKIESDNTTITCYDKDQNPTGQLQPMSPEAIAIYNNNLQLQTAQIQESLQRAQLNFNKIQQQQQQQLLQHQQNLMFMQSLQSQQPQFYTPPRSVKCYTLGNTVYCNEY